MDVRRPARSGPAHFCSHQKPRGPPASRLFRLSISALFSLRPGRCRCSAPLYCLPTRPPVAAARVDPPPRTCSPGSSAAAATSAPPPISSSRSTSCPRNLFSPSNLKKSGQEIYALFSCSFPPLESVGVETDFYIDQSLHSSPDQMKDFW